MTRNFYYAKYFSNKQNLSQNYFALEPFQPAATIKKIYIQVSFKDLFFQTTDYVPYFLFILEFFSNIKVSYGFSKKDVSFWRLRKKAIVSLFITLRGSIVTHFLEKFVTFYFPKVVLVDNHDVVSIKNYLVFNISNFQYFNEFSSEIFKTQESILQLSQIKFKVIVVFNSYNNQNKYNALREFQVPFYF